MRVRSRSARGGSVLFRQVGDHSGEAHALNRLGLLAMATGNLPRQSSGSEKSLALWRELGNQQMIAADLHNLGEARHLSGSLDEADCLYREALALFDELGDARGRGFALCHLGLLALDRGDPWTPESCCARACKLRWSAGLRGSSGRHARGARGSDLAAGRSGPAARHAQGEQPCVRRRACPAARLRSAVSAGRRSGAAARSRLSGVDRDAVVAGLLGVAQPTGALVTGSS